MAFSTTQAPQSKIYREGITAADVIANVREVDGLNCAQYNVLNVEVIPEGGANPTVAVWVWSETASKFVQENPAFTKAGVGADTPYAFSFNVNGRIVFIAVTVIGAGSCKIATSGFDMVEGTG
jgi:hypothetical protein